MARMTLRVDDRFPVTYDGPIPQIGTNIWVSGDRDSVRVTRVDFMSDTMVPVKADMVNIYASTQPQPHTTAT